MRISSTQPRKQRLARYTMPSHQARKLIASHLSEELLLKYNRRSLTLITGDEVKVMRGDHKGKSGKVVTVDVTDFKVTVEGVTNKKADNTEVALPVDPSNLLIVKLNLEDTRRRNKLEGTEEAAKIGQAGKPKERPVEKKKKAPAKKAAAKSDAKAGSKPKSESKPKKTDKEVAE